MNSTEQNYMPKISLKLYRLEAFNYSKLWGMKDYYS